MLINDELQALLPDVVLEIAQIVGMPNALILCEELGGLDFDMPSVVESKQAVLLTSLVGREAMLALLAYFAGERVYIPRCHDYLLAIRNQSFVDSVVGMMEKGGTQKAAIQYYAPMFGFSERWAYEILGRRNAKQMSLFE